MKQPKPVGELMSGLLRDLGQKRRRLELQEALDYAVGPAAAPACQVAGLRAGRLTVEVTSAPLFAELRSFRADAIRRAINEKLGRPAVSTLVFRMGGTTHV